MFCRSWFVLFHLAIVLSVPLRYTDSDYPFGIFKLFLVNIYLFKHCFNDKDFITEFLVKDKNITYLLILFTFF